MTDNIVLRKNTDADRAFIMKTWYSQLRQHGPRWMCAQPTLKHKRSKEDHPGETTDVGPDYMPSIFFDATIRPRIDDLLTREGATIACSDEDPNLIYGVRIGNNTRTHLVFVKSQYRKFGVARKLCEGLGEGHRFTLSTGPQRRISKAGKMPDGWIYDPRGMWRNK